MSSRTSLSDDYWRAGVGMPALSTPSRDGLLSRARRGWTEASVGEASDTLVAEKSNSWDDLSGILL